jgi:hypothetical protein
MAPFSDNVVFTDTSNDKLTWQRIRLLTLLDLPRPEVLMNVWSYQASSPNGKEVFRRSEKIRDLVSAHNDALENAIQYGWSYLSRRMSGDPDLVQQPGTKASSPPSEQETAPKLLTDRTPNGTTTKGDTYFDPLFYNYVTQKFLWVPDNQDEKNRANYGYCGADVYCLGFTHAFQPVRPNLMSILLGAIAAQDPLAEILKTIGCMEGKYEVYPECFPARPQVTGFIDEAKDKLDNQDRELRRAKPEDVFPKPGATPRNTPSCQDGKDAAGKTCGGARKIDPDAVLHNAKIDRAAKRYCVATQRKRLIEDKRFKETVSCETLDAIALEAQETCGMAQTLPLSCFTLEAAQSFSQNSDFSFSTFSLKSLNDLAESRLADLPHKITQIKPVQFSSTRVGLLRAAVADFLFNYKMSQQFPKEFSPYDLQHSAQELNAELNPLVVAFNEDVAAFSQHISRDLDDSRPGLFHTSRSFLSDAIITVRGIGNIQSTVDTVTQSYLDATQAKSPPDILNSLAGQSAGSGSTTGSAAASTAGALEKGALNATTVLPAIAALTPVATQAKIGRELTFQVIPHTLPGASSAELEVTLNAAETTEPGLYSKGNLTGTDAVSRVAKHLTQTRVRVESVKLFELSAFSALLQRPRSKLPVVPPLVELPLIGGLLSIPLPGAKEYHRSTAIVSAVIVPTAADLAYGMDFVRDREKLPNEEALHDIGSPTFLTGAPAAADGVAVEEPRRVEIKPIREFHNAVVGCLATGSGAVNWSPRNAAGLQCDKLTFKNVAILPGSTQSAR